MASPSHLDIAPPTTLPITVSAAEHAYEATPISTVVVVVGGSDSSAGAGVQADLKTVAAHGGYARTVVTAITAQHGGGVTGSWPASPDAVEAQLDAAFLDSPPLAIKTGMLATASTVEAVASAVEAARARGLALPLVVDPVMRSTSGAALLDAAGIEAVRARLLPLASLVTPNASEAALLAGIEVDSLDAAIEAARRIRALGAGAVLVTGGHLAGAPATDILVSAEGVHVFTGVHREGIELHGTGCALASAVATRLARGEALADAVGEAKRYVTALIEAATLPPSGAAMPDHFLGSLDRPLAPRTEVRR